MCGFVFGDPVIMMAWQCPTAKPHLIDAITNYKLVGYNKASADFVEKRFLQKVINMALQRSVSEIKKIKYGARQVMSLVGPARTKCRVLY